MIYYTTDKDIRTNPIVSMACLSLVISYATKPYINIDFIAPSVFGIFWVFYWLYNTFFWKLSPVVSLTGLPNLNGVWAGHINRTDIATGAKEENLPISMTITQTWTKIALVMMSENHESASGATRSDTKTCALFLENKKAITIQYIYAHDKAQGHSDLLLTTENNKPCLKGNFYSNSNRFGYVTLYKQ